jgi:hypothetical protein
VRYFDTASHIMHFHHQDVSWPWRGQCAPLKRRSVQRHYTVLQAYPRKLSSSYEWCWLCAARPGECCSCCPSSPCCYAAYCYVLSLLSHFFLQLDDCENKDCLEGALVWAIFFFLFSFSGAPLQRNIMFRNSSFHFHIIKFKHQRFQHQRNGHYY